MGWIKHHIQDIEEVNHKRKSGFRVVEKPVEVGDIIGITVDSVKKHRYACFNARVLSISDDGKSAVVCYQYGGNDITTTVPINNGTRDAGTRRVNALDNYARVGEMRNYQPPKPFNMDVVSAGASRR